jgi:hypothetical protein
MGKDSNLVGFILGTLAGSVATYNYVLWRRSSSSERICYDEVSQVETTSAGGREESLCPPVDRSAKGYRRQSSAMSSISRRSYRIEEEENEDCSVTNCQIITAEEWAADEAFIQQTKEFDEQILPKLTSKEDMEMACRRSRAVIALAHALAVAEDERACFEVVSQSIVPLFRIDGCAYALLKVSVALI